MNHTTLNPWHALGAIAAGVGIALVVDRVVEKLTAEPARCPSPKLKAQVLERDGRTCVYCRTLTNRRTRQFDHRTAWSRGGRTSLRNLSVSCAACNRAKGAMSAREFRWELAF